MTDNPLYADRSVHPNDLKKLDQMTSSRNWDYSKFRDVLISSATLGRYLPAHNRPESIHFQGMRRHISELKGLSEQHGNIETARAFIVDKQRGKFLQGKTSLGEAKTVMLNLGLEPGREAYQVGVFGLHVHPSLGLSSGMSDTDYLSIITTPELMGGGIIFGDTEFYVFKTTATPNNVDQQQARRRVNKIVEESFVNGISNATLPQLVTFNKSVCTEFGMVLYIAPPQNRDLAERVDVIS